MKLNNSGTVLWQKEIGGTTGLNDYGEKLIIDSNGKIYVAASVNDGKGQDSRLYCFDGASNMLGSTSFNGSNNLDDIPQIINLDLDNNIIVTATEQINSVSWVTRTIKYKLFERNYQYEYVNGNPSFLKGTILVRFKEDKMKYPAMYARKFHAGLLSDFILDSTILEMYNKTGHDWSKYHTYKVLRNTSPADSLSITRLGGTIKAENLWTYLSIDIPENEDHLAICDSLKTIYGHIDEVELDLLFKLYDVPFDGLYNSGQLGLYPNLIYPDADINLEGAWDIEVGQQFVKVGIIDAAINWTHEEFNNGSSNIPGPNQKIGGGYNYIQMNNIIPDQFQPYHHGTSVAGIIGARRNNNNTTGIAGIAGGDPATGTFGAQLFSLVINDSPTAFVPYNTIANAVHDAYSNSTSPTGNNHFGVNIINASWGIGTISSPPILLRQEIKECWKNHCIFVAARGDHEGDNNVYTYPSCFPDLQLISVIASGNNGFRKNGTSNSNSTWSSNYGIAPSNPHPGCNADFCAPGTPELITTTKPFNLYGAFEGTSASAPHITGVAALMYSKHNVSNGYPNNLSTEDIENILQKTAYPKGSPSPNLENGYGLINATEALTQVSDPYYVKHITGNPTYTEENINIQIFTPNQPIQYYPFSKKYIVEWDIDFTLPPGHQIIDWWEFEGAMQKGHSIVTNGSPVNFGSNPIETYSTILLNNPIGSNQIHKTAKMATYLLNGSDNNPNNDIWYSTPKDELEYYFTVHVLKSADAGLDELKSNSFMLYPNPTDNTINVKNSSNTLILNYDIVDVSGRALITKVLNSSAEFSVYLNTLSNGIYYIRLNTETGTESIKFIKK